MCTLQFVAHEVGIFAKLSVTMPEIPNTMRYNTKQFILYLSRRRQIALNAMETKNWPLMAISMMHTRTRNYYSDEPNQMSSLKSPMINIQFRASALWPKCQFSIVQTQTIFNHFSMNSLINYNFCSNFSFRWIVFRLQFINTHTHMYLSFECIFITQSSECNRASWSAAHANLIEFVFISDTQSLNIEVFFSLLLCWRKKLCFFPFLRALT